MHILSACFFSYYKGNSTTGSNTSHPPTSFFLYKTPLLKDNAPRDGEMKSSKERKETFKIGPGFALMGVCICLKEKQ